MANVVKHLNAIRVEAFTAENMTITAFWDVTPRTYQLLPSSGIFCENEQADSSYQAAPCHIPDACELNKMRCLLIGATRLHDIDI
jgi:hypothetical protein